MTTVLFKGTKIGLSGTLPKVGQKAADFKLVGQDLSEVTLATFGGKKKLLNIFPSLDTGVCAKSVSAFYEKSTKLKDVAVLNISMDLPFAAGRFCKEASLNGAVTLSAFRSKFADDYGLKIAEGPLAGLCARVVLVLDSDNKVIYEELVPEIAQEPNYAAALAALS